MVELRPFENIIIHGDCLPILQNLPAELASLVYLDPPFCSNRIYSVIGKRGVLVSFDDRWKGGTDAYVSWLVARLIECKRVLKKTGAIFVQCDPHSSHYLKVALDRIFGQNNFRNEIIWKRQSRHNDSSQGAENFGRIHDVILFYSKSRSIEWHPQYAPYTAEYIRKKYRFVESGTGRRYALGDATGPGGPSKGCPRYEFMGVTRYWRYSKKRMLKLRRGGRIIQTGKGRVPQLKRYLDEMPGLELQDIWDDIPPVGTSKERVNYPTQKPERLLERIVTSCTSPGDLVLDPFCGCGTSVVVSQKLGRKWLGIDSSMPACRAVIRRLARAGIDTRIVRGRQVTPIPTPTMSGVRA